MTTLREAAEKSLEMLEHFQNVTRIGSHDSNAWNHWHRERFMRADRLADETIILLREALAAEPIGFTGYQYQGRTGQWNDFSNEGQYKAAVSIGARPIRVKPCPACGKSLGSAGDIHTCSPQEKN